MDSGLSGQIVAVTGASSGIGEATALACARAGAAVSLAARRKERIDALAERIAGDGGRAIAVQTDVSDEAQAKSFVERTAAELGRVDVLVNNAGVMLLGPVSGADTEEWRRMIDANVYGVYNLTKHGIGAFSEALRQEAVAYGVRVTLVEPGAVATELPGHNRPEILELMAKNFAGVTPLDADDIANAVVYAISQPANVSVNEILVRPSGQVR
jgi:NADP-dependent 3-hydroxy acid dehydrogenase YdfG